MNAPLISVIVPIYNVEKYVRKCLESLVNQTLKQIEVICIDDGSTDSSGAIADEYENPNGWPVIRVIHTENRGLSAARNRGIDEAKADWIMFVDSDDWVDREFCRIPYETTVRENADIVAFQAVTTKHGRVKKPKNTERPVGMVDEMTAYEKAGVVVWNKLYRKDLFDDIRYPEGRIFEDLATTHKLIHKAKKVYLLDDRLYFYIIRKDSITQTHTADNKRAWLAANLEKQEDLISYGYLAARLSIYGVAIGYLSISTPSEDILYQKAMGIVNSVKGYPKGLTIKQKIGLMLWKTNKKAFYIMCKVQNWKM